MSLVRHALNNRWLEEQGVPDVNARRAALAASHKIAKPDRIGGAQRSQSNLDQAALRARCPSLIGTALYGAVRRVVWDPGANHSRGPDSASFEPKCVTAGTGPDSGFAVKQSTQGKWIFFRSIGHHW